MSPLVDPWTAPPRTDLPWLRHRSLRTPTAPAAAPAPVVEKHPIDVRHHEPARTPPSVPAAVAPPAPAPRVVDTSLDLSAPPPTSRPVIAPPATPRPRLPAAHRTSPGRPTILGAGQRTVTLDRLQSGIGTLSIQLAVGDVGDLALGCAYQLTSGHSSTVQLDGGARFGPKDATRPILVMGHDRFETVEVDLRQITEVERLAVFAFSRNGQPLRWGGTLIVTTFGGDKVEVPLDPIASGRIAMVMTGWVVRGEVLLRAELDGSDRAIRELCKAYGYDRIAWLDERTPVA